jgi:flagellar biosynthetic protein FlhB
MAEDMGERTEQPTGRKLAMARARGQIPKSPELSGAVDLIGAVIVLMFFGGAFVEQLAAMMRTMLSGNAPGWGLDKGGVKDLAVWAFLHAVQAAAPFIALMVVVAYLAQLMQVGWLWSAQPLEPKWDRMNPVSGFGRIFSRKNLVKTGIGVLKMGLIGYIVVYVIAQRIQELAGLPALSALAGFHHLGELVLGMAKWMLLVMLVIGVADWWFQRWQHTQDLKMTKQEVQDERKSTEGDEQMKAKRLKMGRQMAMQRMRMDVPKADVVVTNPTHFSVAIRYDADKMDAPKVVAKGADYLAFRIREIALGAGVPIVEKPALARALYAYVAVGQQIRAEDYEAVAEVLAYVYRLEQQAA